MGVVGDGVPLCARVARVTGRMKRHDTPSLSWWRVFFRCVLFCVLLRRCGDAPIPAALVSSPLPFDDQHTHTHTHAHTDTRDLLHCFAVCAALL